MARTIELIEHDRGWTVIGDGRFAAQLGKDEALWTVAMLMMNGPNGYLRTYEEEVAWMRRYHADDGGWREPAALLEDLRVRGPAVTVARRMGVVRRTFDDLGQLVNRFIHLKGSP